MTKLNLLFFGSDYKVGLTQALTEQLVELNKEATIDLTCVSSENEMESGLHHKLDEAGVKKVIVPGLDVHDQFKDLAKKLQRIIETQGITHVNVHNNWQLALISYVKYRKLIPRKFKIIYTIHGYRHNSFAKSIIAIGVIGLALMLLADRVISMSSYVSKKFWFVGWKTDLVFYMMNKPEFLKTSNLIETQPLAMVFPAQFRDGKRQEILIDAMKIYIDRTGDTTAKLYLPGDGPNRQTMIERANAQGIADNVIFPGKMAHKDIIALYEKCNIALVSSNVETYGRCIAEPFALGRCLMTQKTGVAIDIIKPGINGDFFSDANDLAGKLADFYQNPMKVKSMADNAFGDRVQFSRDSVMNTYLESISKA